MKVIKFCFMLYLKFCIGLVVCGFIWGVFGFGHTQTKQVNNEINTYTRER